jgi:hypothetical protein
LAPCQQQQGQLPRQLRLVPRPSAEQRQLQNQVQALLPLLGLPQVWQRMALVEWPPLQGQLLLQA